MQAPGVPYAANMQTGLQTTDTEAVQTAHLHTPVCLFYFTKIHVISCHFSVSGSSFTCATGLSPFLAEGCGFQSSEARWILPLTWSICARLLRQLLKAKLPLQRCITGCHSDGQWSVILLNHEEVPRGKFRPHDDSDSDSQDLPEKLLGFRGFLPISAKTQNYESPMVQRSNGVQQPNWTSTNTIKPQAKHQQIQGGNKTIFSQVFCVQDELLSIHRNSCHKISHNH